MKKIVAFFPGQGSQFVGMGKDLCENFKIATLTLEEASDASKLNLKKLCFEGPESDLTLTENTQPALLAVSVAAFRVAVTELEFKPSLVAGHSLGEYSALVANGALPLASAAAWVRERGKAMQIAVPAGQGGMAALMGIEDDVIAKLCVRAVEIAKEKRVGENKEKFTVDCVLSPANFNAPGQTVVAGSADAVAEAVALLKAGQEFSGKAIPLAVSAPFHSALMAPARKRMAELFKTAKPVAKLDCPYIPNRTARITAEPSAVYELLVDQVDHSVQWRQSVSTMIESGFMHAVEFGPGKVLQGLAKRIVGAHPGKEFTTTGLSDRAGLEGLKTFIAG